MARVTPLLTALHRYDKSLSTWGRGQGTVIEAPVLAWLVETRHGRLLYDVGCDWKKLADPVLPSPGHTAGHVSLLVEREQGGPVLLCGDAADLEENLVDEVAPGLCWKDDRALAVKSIRALKQHARDAGAALWPNHDLAFYRRLVGRAS